MTDWIWTEFVPEDPTCGSKAFECDVDWEDDDVLEQCAARVSTLSAQFGPPAQGHLYTDMGPFADSEYDEHRWFFSLEEHYTAYTKRFDYGEGEMHEGLNYGNLDAMTFTVFFRHQVSREEFGIDLP